MDLDAHLAANRDAIVGTRVFGDPVERDGVTVVPVATVIGGSGGGGDSAGNGGGGLGLIARPAGAFVIRGDEVRWKPAITPWQVLAAVVALAVLLRKR